MNRQQLIDLAYKAEKKYGLPKGMLVAQLHQESSDGTNTYNPEGPVGVMQVQPATAHQLGFDPSDPEQAIDGAGRIMQKNLADANGDVGHALKLYYAGSEKGIGPRSNAYPGQVASKWSPDDAFEAAMGGNQQAPQQPDYEASFDTAMKGNAQPDAASDTPASDDSNPATTDLKAGMQQIASATRSPYYVRHFVAQSGYDPDSMGNLDVNVKTGQIKFDPSFDQNLRPIQHTTGNDLLEGLYRGAHDVGGTLQQFAAYEDQQHPFLASIDNAAHNLIGTPAASGPGSYQDLANANVLTRKAYDQNFDSVASGTGRLGAQIGLTAPVLAAGGTIAAPALEAAPGVGEFLTGRGGTNLITKGLSASTAGVTLGAGTNALTASASDEPLGQRIKEGAEGGAILGPIARGAGGFVQSIANRVAPGVDTATAKLVQLAKDKYGINLDADQITNSPLVRKVSAMMDLNPVNNHLARDVEQRAQFTRAVGKTFGADSDTLSPQVMQAAKDRIGGTMNAIAARNPVHVDDTMMGDLADIENEAQQALPEGEYAPIAKQLDNVISQAGKNNGTLTGEQYQALTRKGSPLDVASNSANPNIRHYAIQVRGALDDALERSASPEDVQALQQARLAYKNMKTVEPLVSKSGDNQITPALLNNRVSVNFKNRAYQGAGDLDELAQIGQRFLKPPSTSGTPEGIRAQRLLENAGTGAALGLALGGHAIGYGTAGELAGLSLLLGRRSAAAGTNAIIKRVFESDAYKNRLLGPALNGNTAPPVNLLPIFTNVGGNRLLQQTYLSPPPQPQNP